jgi:tripartite-type tricarboxylate transporter receptor subunit TctC
MTTIGAPPEAALLTRNVGRTREGIVRTLLRASALAALQILLSLVVLPLAANAQNYPTKPIRLVVPFPPGGPNDIIGRVVGQKIQDLLGQLVIIDNRAGAGGVVGADNVAKSEPDGYSIGIASAGALALSAVLLEKMRR